MMKGSHLIDDNSGRRLSEVVEAFGIDESPLWMECKVRDVIEISELAGSGNLVIAEIIKFHVNENIIDASKLWSKCLYIHFLYFVISYLYQ